MAEYYVGGFSFKKLWKGVKSVVKSPIMKTAVGALAIVYPPVGIPAAAALASANAAIKAAEHHEPGVRAAAKAMIKNTAKLAKGGNPGAQRAMHIMLIAKKSRQLGGGPRIGRPYFVPYKESDSGGLRSQVKFPRRKFS